MIHSPVGISQRPYPFPVSQAVMSVDVTRMSNPFVAFTKPSVLTRLNRDAYVIGNFQRKGTTTCSVRNNQPSSLYELLGLPQEGDPTKYTHSQIRKAYLQKAKQEHPDVNISTDLEGQGASSDSFAAIARAWRILSDPKLRKVYDDAGEPGLSAVESMAHRSEQISKSFADVIGDELDFLSDTGQLVGTLLSPSSTSADDTDRPPERGDACPRSVSEAIWNLRNSSDDSVRYYTLWWVYRFKVKEALPQLIEILRTAPCTKSGVYPLRRRAALALGVIASPPTETSTDVVDALSDALELDDYFLRYRAAEAVANIAYRAMDSLRQSDGNGTSGPVKFPSRVVNVLLDMLRRGSAAMEQRREASSGFSNQESLFDFDNLEPEVRKKLEHLFKKRRENEQMRMRTTMTPQLGVSAVGSGGDEEPHEWVIKAISAIATVNLREDTALVCRVQHGIEPFVSHDVPLVRYAACKALYALTGETHYVARITDALNFGIEHHYSQRVLIRDLGDLGYWQGARAIAECPMVENSFKILALKNMLTKLDYDAARPEVREVLGHMDSLL